MVSAYMAQPGAGIAGLRRIPVSVGPLGPDEVRLSVRAVALNARDLRVIGAIAPFRELSQPVVPCSDAAGTVMEVGALVSRVKPGDRAITTFFPDWQDGVPTPGSVARTFGANSPGVLAEQIIVPARALVPIPAGLAFAEAATVTCAGVTAWNALFETGRVQAGEIVLLLGTGGVSVMALQLAKAAGLTVIITSSDDRKLGRCRDIGADHTINYAHVQDWDKTVLSLTDGLGAHVVLEVGGPQTLLRSLASLRMGGVVASIGSVGGLGTVEFNTAALSPIKRLAHVLVGNRRMAEDMMQFLAKGGIKPVVDRIFDFADAADAFAYLKGRGHFGKVVITSGT